MAAVLLKCIYFALHFGHFKYWCDRTSLLKFQPYMEFKMGFEENLMFITFNQFGKDYKILCFY